MARTILSCQAEPVSLSTSHIHRKVIDIPVASFRMPAPLSAETQHRSVIETIINLGGRPAWYIVSVG